MIASFSGHFPGKLLGAMLALIWCVLSACQNSDPITPGSAPPRVVSLNPPPQPGPAPTPPANPRATPESKQPSQNTVTSAKLPASPTLSLIRIDREKTSIYKVKTSEQIEPVVLGEFSSAPRTVRLSRDKERVIVEDESQSRDRMVFLGGQKIFTETLPSWKDKGLIDNDGRTLVYTKDNELWAIDIADNGSEHEHQLEAKVYDFTWLSPQREEMVVALPGNVLEIVNPRTGEKTSLAGLSWLRDAYATTLQDFRGNFYSAEWSFHRWQIWSSYEESLQAYLSADASKLYFLEKDTFKGWDITTGKMFVILNAQQAILLHPYAAEQAGFVAKSVVRLVTLNESKDPIREQFLDLNSGKILRENEITTREAHTYMEKDEEGYQHERPLPPPDDGREDVYTNFVTAISL